MMRCNFSTACSKRLNGCYIYTLYYISIWDLYHIDYEMHWSSLLPLYKNVDNYIFLFVALYKNEVSCDHTKCHPMQNRYGLPCRDTETRQWRQQLQCEQRWCGLMWFGRCHLCMGTIIAKFLGPTWSPSGADRTQVGPMLAPGILLSGECLCRGADFHVCRSGWLGCPYGRYT